MRHLALIALAAAVAFASGCVEDNAAYMTSERMNNGLVVILPGIEGESAANREVRSALDASGVDRALPIWHWGVPIPGAGMIINQIDFGGNRLRAKRIADRIVKYQDEHPGRPVHLVGHSGGGGIAVLAAEQLPEGRKVDGLVLLSASISIAHDVTKALKNCRSGIVNFYNRGDAALLGVGTTILGNVDGRHGPSAGLLGFDPPGASASDETRLTYSKLFQVELSGPMISEDLGGAHFSTTRYGFVLVYVSPWVRNPDWPADQTGTVRRSEVLMLTAARTIQLLRPTTETQATTKAHGLAGSSVTRVPIIGFASP
ncbi:MAG: alpha/beta fold hydrolase [Phycisphaerae bacterium]|jgi:pimeloyl-ACP methyl ester carboxylesterase|nr:alpha/beta fold hydrolase [Phycisphaerae bacterium]